jgi:hypothetical protein
MIRARDSLLAQGDIGLGQIQELFIQNVETNLSKLQDVIELLNTVFGP